MFPTRQMSPAQVIVPRGQSTFRLHHPALSGGGGHISECFRARIAGQQVGVLYGLWCTLQEGHPCVYATRYLPAMVMEACCTKRGYLPSSALLKRVCQWF